MQKTMFAAVLALLLPTATTAQTRTFGQAQGWETLAEFDGTQFLGCGAEHPGNTGFMGLAQSADGTWWLFMGFVGVQGTQAARITVDGVALPARPVQGDGHSAQAPLSPADREALGRGARLRVELAGGGHAEWALAGSSAAMTMVATCVARRGRAG